MEKKNIKLLADKVLILMDPEGEEVVTKSATSDIVISIKKPVVTVGTVVQRGPKTEYVAIGDRVEINPGISSIVIDGVDYILTNELMIKYIIL